MALYTAPRTECHGRQRRYSIDYVQREQYFLPLVTREQLCNVVHPVLGVLVHNVCNVRDYVCALVSDTRANTSSLPRCDS